jgi:hypothetical protein
MLVTINLSRGSTCLAGAASLKHRMPLIGDCLLSTGYSSVGRATDSKSVGRRFDSCFPTIVLL